MKNIKTLAVVAVLGVAVCGFAIAQVRHGLLGHGPAHHKAAASAMENVTETFAKLAAFDANKDGQFDATEKKSLAKAIAEGTLQLPVHTPPNGVIPSAEMMLDHVADMYAQFALYDANHDGAFDATEQATLKSAIERGELPLPGRHSHDVGGPHQ